MSNCSKKRNHKIINPELWQSPDRIPSYGAPSKHKKTFFVHELVAKTFVPNPDNLPYVEHIDGDRLNNCASNLRWTAIMPEGYPQPRVKKNKNNKQYLS